MLGRGLESLIPKRQAPAQVQTQAQQLDSQLPAREAVFAIEISKIKPNPYQPRREFDREALKELAESIRNHGILQPLVATKAVKDTSRGADVEYQLVAGERRLRAAKIVGLTTVPVIVRDAPPRSKLELSLIENVQREDLNAIEKALAFKQLIDEFGLKHIDVAKRIGKSREAVSNALRLLQLSPKIQQAIHDGKISENHARAILTVRDPKKQSLLYETIVRNGLPAKEAERMAREVQLSDGDRSSHSHFRHKASEKTVLVELSPEVKELEEKIRGALRIQAVSVHFVKDKPKVTLKFDSKKELIQLLDKIRTTLI